MKRALAQSRRAPGIAEALYGNQESTLTNKVLVVEDEQILAQNLGNFLEAKGLDVRVTNDGAEAIAQAASFQPELIVLDYRLPDMEGFEVLNAIRRDRSVHCVLITGHPTNEVRDRAARLGISHILFKPFPLAELARTVLELLQVPHQGRVDKQDGFVERRRVKAETFPLRLYDGSWVLGDRRQAGPPDQDADDDPLASGGNTRKP